MAFHGHSDQGIDAGWAFRWAVVLNVVYVLIEASFGFLTGSLALIADAAHNLTDVLGLLIGWGALVLGRLKPNQRHTYGFGRATILAALVNSIVLLIGVGVIVWEAVARIGTPQDVPAITVLWVAGVGISVNAGSALLFLKGRSDDLNVRGAFLHMAADAAVSAAVVVSAGLMILTGWTVIDPIAAILVSAAIAWSAAGLLRSAMRLSLDGVPESVDRAAVEAWLRSLPGVTDLHDLHIWALSTTSVAVTVHLVMPGECSADAFLERTAHDLAEKFGIAHATIQIEQGTGPECVLANGERP
jgi:cobalt-zinc-cadmium efflux system protein